MEKTSYKIGEVASLLTTSIRTIRYYEEEGLLKPIRTAGGTRLYSDVHIARLRAILQLTRNGLSLTSIKAISQVRQCCTTGQESSQQVTVLLEQILETIESQIAELHRLEEEMVTAKQVIKKCNACTNPPNSIGCPSCPVRDHLSHVKFLSLIWDESDLGDGIK
ncbi:MAG: MerR family transcriptional regulator [Thiotrichaceae bacterium]